jgi:hypothetical protein
VHGVIAAGASSSAWSFGSSILTFAFPMILFVVVAAGLYVAYTKPELVPGHRNPAVRHSVSYTTVPGRPQTAVRDQATSDHQAAAGGQPAAAGQATSGDQAASGDQAETEEGA